MKIIEDFRCNYLGIYTNKGWCYRLWQVIPPVCDTQYSAIFKRFNTLLYIQSIKNSSCLRWGSRKGNQKTQRTKTSSISSWQTTTGMENASSSSDSSSRHNCLAHCPPSLPRSRHHFHLSPNKFRDALAIRYRRPLQSVYHHHVTAAVAFNMVS